MLNHAFPGRRNQQGMTLIELMVAMVAGLILIGSVIGLVVANLNNTNAVVRGMKLTQESRAITEIITRELRRVRFNGDAITQIGSGATLTAFETIDIATVGCIKYGYDADGDGTADNGEFRMFSRTVGADGRGVVRYGTFANAGAVSCTGGTIISSDDINITTLTFANSVATRIDFTLAMNTAIDGQTTSTRTTTGSVMIRSGDPIAAAP